ncbi:MAG: hypothetical protein RQ751_12280, partial [Longimicrobiales bacterium]|nr:hypothetical protein [Longimicrobiales bacterium]
RVWEGGGEAAGDRVGRAGARAGVLAFLATPRPGAAPGALLVALAPLDVALGRVRRVAHELNNLLMTILTLGDLVRSELPAGSDGVADLEEIRAAAHRAGELVRDLHHLLD